MSPSQSEREPEFWEHLAKVAMGLRGDDPVNWPHYADDARQLEAERTRYRDALQKVYDDIVDLRWEHAGEIARFAREVLADDFKSPHA